MPRTTEPGPRVVARDPAAIRRWATALNILTAPFAPEVTGTENIPRTGPALVVGNHSLVLLPEVWAAVRAIFERRGVDAPMAGLAYDLLFSVPWVGAQLRRVGGIPADPAAAEAVLSRGELVLVYPGGDLDACRPWTHRDRVELGGHRGFVRLALRTGAPVVPVVAHGAQHGVPVLVRGDRIARALRLDVLRVHVFPIFLAPPFGISSILAPPLPLPATVSLRFLPPLDWSNAGAAAADDPVAVEACYAQVQRVMQAEMDRLAAEHPHPVTSALTRLATAPARRAWAAGRRRP